MKTILTVLFLSLAMLIGSGCATTGGATTQPAANLLTALADFQTILADANSAIAFAQATGLIDPNSAAGSKVLAIQTAANDLNSAALSAQSNGLVSATTQAQAASAIAAIKQLAAHPNVQAAKVAKAQATK